MMSSTIRVTAVGLTLALVAACSPGREPHTVPTTGPEPLPGPVIESAGISISVPAHAEYIAAADLLIVAVGTADQPGPADGALTAYRLSDGEVEWETTVPDTLFGNLAVSAVVGDALVVEYQTIDVCAEPRSSDDLGCTYHAVSAFRLSDGEVLWQRLGLPVTVDPDEEVLVVSLPQTPPGREPLATGLRVQTGEVVWSREDMRNDWDSHVRIGSVPEQELDWLQVDRWHLLPRSPHLIVTTSNLDGDCYSYTVEVLASRTGDAVWSRSFDGCTEPVRAATVSQGLALVDAGGIYRGYDLDTGHELWRTELNPMFGNRAATCGESICLGLAEPQHALDRQTGDEQWRGGRGPYLWTVPTQAGPRLVNATREIHYEDDPGFDRGICTVDPCTSLRWAPIRPAVLSAADGGLLLDLHDWHLADFAGDRALLFRNPESYWALAGDAEFAVADLTEPTVHYLGVVPDLQLFEVIDPGYPEAQAEACRIAGAEVLVCRRTDHSLELWRYRV